MSDVSEQMQQIKTLISSATKSDKSFAYSSLHHLQEQASIDDSVMNPLVESSDTILRSIISDICVDDADEEILALALKCLGFTVFHPSIVSTISKQCVSEVLESLARLITTTKIKAVCNLGVWCISIQQLDASSLDLHFDSLLRSVIHSIDNPVGSLSTTFEAIQAVTKLTTQISEKMRDSSSIWAPPIYRRLLSADKRESDMSLRCLLKVKCIIFPPRLALSKAIAHDMRRSLIPKMKEMLKQGKQVQALQAWGWFIRILGYHSLKSRQLVNEMLKVPEQTFSDPDAQIQIATLVAWEGLVDAFLGCPSEVCDTVTVHQPHVKDDTVNANISSVVNGGIIHARGFLKGLNLIMTPVIGIMSSKAGFSVQSSCLNTWRYLLHKLDCLINDPHVLGTVVEPMCKVAFNIDLDDKNIWIWRFCMDIFCDFIQSKSSSLNCGSDSDVICKLLPETTNSKSPLVGDCAVKNYSIKWSPWNENQMDFLVGIIQMVFSQAAMATLSSENNSLVLKIMLRMFRFFFKGVQTDLARSSTSYDSIMRSMNTILGLVKTVCEGVLTVDGESSGFQLAFLQALRAVTEELDPYILGSPLYKVPLDLKYVCQGEARCKLLMDCIRVSPMDLVLPVTYLTVLYYSVVLQMNINAASHDSTLQEAYAYLKRLVSSYDSLEVLHAINATLYICVKSSSLRVWITLAKCLRDHCAKDLLPLNIQPACSGSHTLRSFLIFPLVVCSSRKPISSTKHLNSSTFPPFAGTSTLEEVNEVWVSLYGLVYGSSLTKCLRKNSSAEDLCSLLNDFLQQSDSNESMTEANAGSSSPEHPLLLLSVDVAKCILDNLHVDKVTPEEITSGAAGSSGISNCLVFVARLMNLIRTKMQEGSMNAALSRLLPPLTYMVGRLQWKEDITSVIKVLSEPLVPWMSDPWMKWESLGHQLQLLWTEIIGSLQRSWPAVEFDSSFLKLQASLLEKALLHPSPSISEPTANFWNSAYGEQVGLDYPLCLLPVLDKLSRLGKIKVQQRSSPASRKYSLNLPRHKVTATLSACSKRVELLKNVMVSPGCNSELPPCPKRKRPELTEHQKEVRRAQQGKGRDCSGHGPGIRTYTSVDFSQGNEDSQDSQDIRGPELILGLLRRAG